MLNIKLSSFPLMIAAFVFWMCPVTFAQTDETVRLWETRAGSITNNLQIEISKLGGSDKILGYARLGEEWWKHDEQAGRRWFTRAVDYGTSPSSDFKDNNERLSALRDLLKVVASKDADLAKKLARKLSEAAQELSEKDDEATNDAILKAATELINVDVNQAFGLASLTLKSKRPAFSFSSILFSLKLGSKNRSLANDYFAMAVDVARAKSVTGMYEYLIRVAFPNAIQAQYESPISEANRRRLLETLAIRFTVESIEALEGRRSNCSLTSFWAPRLRTYYESLLPEKLALLDQAIKVCQVTRPADPAKTSETNEAAKTADDLLREAERTSDKETKAGLLISASWHAVSEKRYQLAFETLLSIDNEYRSKPFGVWEAALMTASAPMIIDQIKTSDIAAANRSFARIPAENRPLVRIAVTDRLDDNLFKSLVKDILDSARKELAKTDFKPPRDVRVLLSSPELYCSVVGFYRDLGFEADAIETHEESIAAVNRYLAQVPTDLKKEVVSALPIKWARFSTFDGEFLDTHFMLIENSLSKIDYAPVRRDVDFAWLKSTLKRLMQMQEEVEKSKKTKKVVQARQK